MHFTDSIKLARGSAIALIKGWDDERAVFAYVLMGQDGYKKACAAYDHGQHIQFDDLGEILVTGNGHTPPASIEHFIAQYAAELNKAQ